MIGASFQNGLEKYLAVFRLGEADVSVGAEQFKMVHNVLRAVRCTEALEIAFGVLNEIVNEGTVPTV